MLLFSIRWLKDLNEYGLCLLTGLPARKGELNRVCVGICMCVCVFSGGGGGGGGEVRKGHSKGAAAPLV